MEQGSPRLVIAKRAYRAAVDEILAHPESETGGILVGRKVAGDFVVPFVVGGGPGAERSWGGFAPDSAWQQEFLDFLFKRFDLDYLGDFHRHPGRFDRPSRTDWQTARKIVIDETWGTPEALFPIAVVEEGRVRIRAYVMSRGAKNFVEIPIEVVPDSDPRMAAVLIRTEVMEELDNEENTSRCVGGSGRGGPGLRRWLSCLRVPPTPRGSRPGACRDE
jgi:integrative and conjugative element protein (TIGR02256 family)